MRTSFAAYSQKYTVPAALPVMATGWLRVGDNAGPTPAEEFDTQSESGWEVERAVKETGDGEESEGGDCWGL